MTARSCANCAQRQRGTFCETHKQWLGNLTGACSSWHLDKRDGKAVRDDR